MDMRFIQAACVLGLVVSLSACQRTTGDSFAMSTPSAPTPLQAQPVSQVQTGQLSDPSQFPQAPAADTTVASVPVDAAPPATAMDVTKESMVGNWKVATAGISCDMFLTLTNLGSGSRGGTRGCAGVLSTMGSWEVAGKQVLFKDRDGNVLGSVYKSADARFDGSTGSGQPVSLSR
jgi:Protease inhibitor Inh